MRRNNLFKLAMLACATIAFSLSAQSQIKFGARAGMNLSNVTGTDVAHHGMKLGFHAGGMVHIVIKKKFSLQPEVLFSTKGYKDIDNSEIKFALNYIDVPILLNYKTDIGIYFEAGPSVGVLLTAKYKDGSNSVDEKKDVSLVDVGVAFGAGYMLDNGLGFGARFHPGILNINKEGEDKNHNSVIMINICYLFDNDR